MGAPRSHLATGGGLVEGRLAERRGGKLAERRGATLPLVEAVWKTAWLKDGAPVLLLTEAQLRSHTPTRAVVRREFHNQAEFILPSLRNAVPCADGLRYVFSYIASLP